MVLRFGQVLGVRPDRFAEYRTAHAAVWPEILEALSAAGIRNYSIFHFGGRLFGYYEYVGPPDEYAGRMQELAASPRMRQWWDWMEPMQVPLEGRASGEWWAAMEEVFHHD